MNRLSIKLRERLSRYRQFIKENNLQPKYAEWINKMYSEGKTIQECMSGVNGSKKR